MAKLKHSGITLLSKTTVDTDLSTTGQTVLYTVPPNTVTLLVAAYLKAAGDVGANLQCQIGQNSATTDFVIDSAGDNLDAANDVIPLMPIPHATPPKLKMYTAGTVIEFDITVGGNAVAGTVYLLGLQDDA